MTGYFVPIEEATLSNKNFRKVLYTGKFCQLVVMCLQPGEEIGNEVHEQVDQFFRIEAGEVTFILDEKEEHILHQDDAAIIPAGTYHNVINTSKTAPVFLYTIYSPPNHPGGTTHKTKAEAIEAEEHEYHR